MVSSTNRKSRRSAKREKFPASQPQAPRGEWRDLNPDSSQTVAELATIRDIDGTRRGSLGDFGYGRSVTYRPPSVRNTG